MFASVSFAQSILCDYSSDKHCSIVPANTRTVQTTRAAAVLFQDFSESVFPPTGWDTIQGAESENLQHWHRSTTTPQYCEGEYSYAAVEYANSDHVARNQDEWLISPTVNIPSEMPVLTFDYYSNPGWFVADWGTFNNVDCADFNVKVSEDGQNWTTVWNDDEFSAAVGGAAGFPQMRWTTIYVNLSAFAGRSVRIAFQYVGYDASMFYLDNVMVKSYAGVDYELADARVNYNSSYVNYGYNGFFSYFPRREITSESKINFEGVVKNYGSQSANVNLVAKVFNPNNQQIFSYTFAQTTVPAASFTNGIYKSGVDTIVYYTPSGTEGSFSIISASIFAMNLMTVDGTYTYELSVVPYSGTYSNENNRTTTIEYTTVVSDNCLYSRDNGNYAEGSGYVSNNPQWNNFTAFGTNYQIYSSADVINSAEAYIAAADNGAQFHYEIFTVSNDTAYTSVLTTTTYTVDASTFTPGFIKLFTEEPLSFGSLSGSQELLVAVVVENGKKVTVGVDESVQPACQENKAKAGNRWYYISGTNGVLMIRLYNCMQGSVITVLSNNDEYGTTSGSGRYDDGSIVPLLATPNEGYRFVSWSDESTDNPHNITVAGDATYTATFEPIPTYTITAVSNIADYGTVTGGGTYYENTVISIEANPAEGYRFVSWQDNNNDNPRQITVTEDAMFIATFELIPMHTITVVSNNEEFGTVTGGGTFEEGSVITITARPNDGYAFFSWNDGNEDSEREITVTEDATYIATFIFDVNLKEVYSADISIFPNPASDMLNISSSENISAIEFVTATGQVVSHVEINSNEYNCNIKNLANGLYLVKIYGETKLIGVRKIIKD